MYSKDGIDRNNHTGYAQVVEEMNEEGVLVSRYHYGHDLVAADKADLTSVSDPVLNPRAEYRRYYYHYDGLGSVRAISEENGDTTEKYDYDAYGILIDIRKRDSTSGQLTSLPIENFAQESSNRYLFTGEQFDTDLGMYYLRARYLNTQTGRFHNMDTYEGRTGEPQTLHKYLYAHSNPVSNIDPSGNFSLSNISASIGASLRLSASLGRVSISAQRIGGQLIAKTGRILMEVFIRTVARAWSTFIRAGRSALLTIRSQLRNLTRRLKQFVKNREPIIYLHYSFLRFADSFRKRGLVPFGGPAFATWSLYSTGWSAKKGLALFRDGPRNALYLVWPKKGFRGVGPSIVRPEIDTYIPGVVLPGGGTEFRFTRGSGGPGTVFGPIPWPTGSSSDSAGFGITI